MLPAAVQNDARNCNCRRNLLARYHTASCDLLHMKAAAYDAEGLLVQPLWNLVASS